ncbi:MAG: plasmid maintenance system killer protein [Chloroflexi bacterium HGW-Chloroflexi-1]|nr:MAG: plasmid maintenance system killer protein [Chloroflexi bacterium HGW-Chloroflexi-1]
MIRSFRNAGTEDIFDGDNTRAARQACPESLWKVAFRKLDQLDSVGSLDDLRVPPGNQLEALTGDRQGQFSIRINRQYRICFVWTELGPDAVEIVDYH